MLVLIQFVSSLHGLAVLLDDLTFQHLVKTEKRKAVNHDSANELEHRSLPWVS